jgi:hypothetical protein
MEGIAVSVWVDNVREEAYNERRGVERRLSLDGGKVFYSNITRRGESIL